MEAIEREKLTASDVIGFSVYRLTTANVHVTDDAIIRLYHQMKIARSAVKATAEDGYSARAFCVAWCCVLGLRQAGESGDVYRFETGTTASSEIEVETYRND
jgi:hypothetical protein